MRIEFPLADRQGTGAAAWRRRRAKTLPRRASHARFPFNLLTAATLAEQAELTASVVA